MGTEARQAAASDGDEDAQEGGREEKCRGEEEVADEAAPEGTGAEVTVGAERSRVRGAALVRLERPLHLEELLPSALGDDSPAAAPTLVG